MNAFSSRLSLFLSLSPPCPFCTLSYCHSLSYSEDGDDGIVGASPAASASAFASAQSISSRFRRENVGARVGCGRNPIYRMTQQPPRASRFLPSRPPALPASSSSIISGGLTDM